METTKFLRILRRNDYTFWPLGKGIIFHFLQSNIFLAEHIFLQAQCLVSLQAAAMI